MKKAAFAGQCTWLLLFCWLGIVVMACQYTTSPTPVATIPEDKMAHILADLNIAEAATARLNGYPKDSLMHVYFQQVMEMHGVTIASYEAQLRLIASDPLRMEKLLKDSENLLEDKVEEKTEDTK